MTARGVSLTPTEIIATAVNVMETGGYRLVQDGFPEWDTSSTRLFEDEYNIVGIAVFTTTAELLASWADWQAALVEVISHHVGKAEGKAWDGYLVLLTAGLSPSSDASIEELRYDTTRLRKLVATGEDIRSARDVEQLLQSLLPLSGKHREIAGDTALDLLPGLLAEHGISRGTTDVLVQSYLAQGALMEDLHRKRSPQ